jgi:catechol 2,3-dioxygenase-like lactoylglutathione lyase family enzyme
MVNMNLGYATVGSNNLDRAKTFYDALLLPFGFEIAFEHPSGGRVYGQSGQIAFGVVGPFDGKQAQHGNGVMISFRCKSQNEVEAVHSCAMDLGATDEGAPGVRGGPYFMSYFRDPDGNKLCAFFQEYAY